MNRQLSRLSTAIALVGVFSGAFTASAFAQAPTVPSAGTPPGASAPPPVPSGKYAAKGGRLKALDTNNDGLLSRDEVKGNRMLTKNFDAIDTNKDGQLSKDELKAFRAARKAQAKP